MKSVNIRSLKHETGAVMERVAMGESVEITRRNHPIAVITPVATHDEATPRPNFRKRLQAIYGDRALQQTASDLLSEERGER